MSTEFVKGNPYFFNEKKLKQFPYLEKNMDCDVLIVGGGITGAITAYFFAKAGVKTILIESGRIGHLSTSCATAILEYQLDDDAKTLRKHLKDENIVEAYKLGLDSLSVLNDLISSIKADCEYEKCATLIYSLNINSKKELKEEVEFRSKNGFTAKLIDENFKLNNFEIKTGILCENGGAQLNPYMFCCELMKNAEKNKAHIFENTQFLGAEYYEDKIIAKLNYGYEITAKKIICTTGYNTAVFSDEKLCNKLVTYSIATFPLKTKLRSDFLFHDNESPYHYLKVTKDNRIVIGGGDTLFNNSKIDKKLAEKKYIELEQYLKKQLCPMLSDEIVIENKFCGTFSATLDNLGVVGESKLNQNLWYNLGYGANGILFTIIGAEILINKYFNKSHKYAHLFDPKRRTLI